MGAPSIHDYALIGDGRTAALVSRQGAIDWLCWPRFDGDAWLARLLDPEKGGSWRLAPEEAGTCGRGYAPASNVLVSDWRLSEGHVRVFDFMPVGRYGGLTPEHAVIRLLRCESGNVRMRSTLLLRPSYGKSALRWKSYRYCHRSGHGNMQVSLQAFGAAPDVLGETLQAEFRLRAGETAGLILAANRDAPAILFTEQHLWRMLESTLAGWKQWMAGCTYDGPWRDAIERSALVLKALSFAPSGAVIAAPTTSLPEEPGGALNWDYRYCWLRDASQTTRALRDLGFAREAQAFVSWLLHATALSRPRLRVLYDVFGRRPPGEQEVRWLHGYGDSRPVRIGNAAEDQHQLDVYGEVIDSAFQQMMDKGGADRATARLVLELASYACRHWREADAGIWEYRNELRQHVHSKLLCWVAADRAARLRDRGLLPPGGADFHRVRGEIAAWIRAAAEHAGGILTAADGNAELDAGVLLAAPLGVLEPDDPLLSRTFAAIRERLHAGPALLYRAERFRGIEGAFLFCSFWAVEVLAMQGREREATDWMEGLLALRNDVGLLAEEADPRTGAAWGNFPQAFSHIGLINAALAIGRARERRPRRRHRA